MKSSLTLCFVVAMYGCVLSQSTANKTRIVVRSFEYVWEHTPGVPAKADRVIFLKEASFRDQARKSFIDAFQKIWFVDVPVFDINIKPLSGFSFRPKFKTKLKNADMDVMYAFIQVFDKGQSLNYESGAYQTEFEILFRLINGKDGSIVSDRATFISFVRKAPLGGEIVLNRLPGDPVSFMNLIDSLAVSTLDTNATDHKQFELRPAYVYDKSQLHLTRKQTVGKFSISTNRVKIDEIGKKKNVVGNSLAGAFTLFSGVGTEKVKAVKYEATHSFFDGTDTIYVPIKYSDEQRAGRERVKHDDGYKSLERGEYYSARILDKEAINFMLKGVDTIGWFKVNFEGSSAAWSQMWNGFDTSTITSFPSEWNNVLTTEMRLSGQIGKQDFSVVTLDKGAIKKLTFDDVHVANIYGRDTLQAALFHDISEENLNIIIALSRACNYYFNFQ
jgi:hypothetical protein